MRLAIVERAAYGGLLHYAAQFADALARRGHDVELLAARGNELLGRRVTARMRPVLSAAAQPSEPRSGLRYVIRRGAVGARVVRASARIAWELRLGGYDAAVLTDDLDLPLTAGAALLLTLVPGRPVLAAVCHEPRPRNRWAGSELYSSSRSLLALLRRTYKRMDLVFVHGERSRREFRETWGPLPVAVIPHGDARIIAEEAPQPAGEERILFFGDWRRAKGLHELLAAFDRLARRRPTVRLTIAGRPSPDGDPDFVRRWAADRRNQVELIDNYIPLSEVPALFGRARVVAAPYLAGSQSGVVHLAMTMSRAVVASDIGELGQTVINGTTGRLVSPGDVEGLAEALEEIVSDPVLAARLGEEARRRVLVEASWERVAERVEAALSAVREEADGSPP
jgi:glycosyltransferase involved in cell wall biosynthesis